MKYSLVIPTYKRPDDLRNTLVSVFNQSRKPDELIIIDDDVLPNEILESFRQKSNSDGIQFHYHKKDHDVEPRGLSESKNLALKIASWDVVIIVDDDIVFPPQALDSLMTVWDKYGSDDKLIGVGGTVINSRKKTWYEKTFNKIFGLTSRLPFDVNDVGFQVWNDEINKFTKGYYLYGCISSFRRQTARQIGFRELASGRTALEDVDFCLRAKRLGYYFLIEPKAAIYHYQAKGGRDSEFETGFKEGRNRKLIFQESCQQDTMTKIRFIWANLGWILRQILVGHFPRAHGMIRGLFSSISNNVTKSSNNSSQDNRQVLITGGCGFVGVNLVSYLLDHTNWHIKVLDNLSVCNQENLKAVSQGNEARVTFHRGDIRNLSDLLEASQNIHTIYHLAAESGIPPSINDPLGNRELNIDGTLNVLEAARRNNVNKVIFASSAAPLGEQRPPLHEKMVAQPISPYGATKLAGEAYCSAYSGSFDLDTVVLRFSNIYGPWSAHKTSAVHQFIKLMSAGEPVTIHGDGLQTRDLIHIEDICQGLLLATTTNLADKFSLFQLGTEKETSIAELFAELKRQLESRGLSVQPPIHNNDRAGDVKRNYTNTQKAQKNLEFSPKINLTDGLAQTIRWYLDRSPL